MAELVELIEVHDRLYANARSIESTLSVLRSQVASKANEVKEIGSNPKVILEYLRSHGQGLQLPPGAIRGLCSIFQWPLEFDFADDFCEVTVEGSLTTFRNPKNGDSFVVDLGEFKAAEPTVSLHSFNPSF
jgi:hypothetical protein